MSKAIIVETKDGNSHAFLGGRIVIRGDMLLIVEDEEAMAVFNVFKIKAAYPKYVCDD